MPSPEATARLHRRAPIRWLPPRVTAGRARARPVWTLDERTLLGEVAGHPVPGGDLDGQRRLDSAQVLRLGTAGPEDAARGGMLRAGQFAMKQDPVARGGPARIRHRHR